MEAMRTRFYFFCVKIVNNKINVAKESSKIRGPERKDCSYRAETSGEKRMTSADTIPPFPPNKNGKRSEEKRLFSFILSYEHLKINIAAK